MMGAPAGIGTVLLYWDYDTQWGADRSRAGSGPAGWGALEFTHTEELLTLLDGFRIRACFAVVGAAAGAGARPYHDPGQVRELHAAGHEVASHGLTHEWLPAIPADTLRDMLRRSREVLEDCIGAPVVSFVPPFNQPFDFPAALAFSLSERRRVRGERTDIPRLCAALAATGFRTSRLSYAPWPRRALERVAGRSFAGPEQPRRVRGVVTVRVNTPGGFGGATLGMVDAVGRRGGIAVAYGHPHSLHGGGTQDRRHLLPFLERVAALRQAGRLATRVPRDLLDLEAP